MACRTLLITPPFTQLNTPYPATSYLMGFLRSKGCDVNQCDLSIELFNEIFSHRVLADIFDFAEELEFIKFDIVWKKRDEYMNRVDAAIAFLRNPDESKANTLLANGYLPKGHRSEKLATGYGELDIIDKAKHLCTLFIEELGDFITANVDEFFAFTRYAEQIATAASNFDQIEEFLNYEPTLIEEELLQLLESKLNEHQPDLVAFTIPFPGNLFSALRCAQHIKYLFPHIKIAFGGGYCNTELRSLSDPRIFEYIDFISLDDGEIPMLKIIEHTSSNTSSNLLERTFVMEKRNVVYKNHLPNTIVHHRNLPTPTYDGLQMNIYLSFLDVINPMHRLWTDGKWNKLTISHGCYWKQCSFCDVSLDYIGNYENTTSIDLVNKIEDLMKETNNRHFHFVDEAAPPKALKGLAEELLARKVNITWWTNIRFEKTFTKELCALMAASGCIAVSGGLEVASDRLLAKMKKGVDIEQVARVTDAFSTNNIMVHAYLMYGFPTQTEQETIDSLEVVRQLFKAKCIQSAFWHLFTATAHSPIGKDPESFGIEIVGPAFEGFAQNDLIHEDPSGANHRLYTEGLNNALNSYLKGIDLEKNVSDWFDFEVKKTTVNPHLITEAVN